jgi:transposase
MTRLAGVIDGVIGVDTHRDTLAAAVTDMVGGLLAQTSVRADGAGYCQLFEFARVQVPGRRCWAVEGAGSYGAGLAAFLQARGERVVEVARPSRSLEHRMTIKALRLTAQRIHRLAVEAAGLRADLDRLVAAAAPWLLELPGVGPISAAQVLVSWSHAGRLRSEAAFAALAGANPIPAFSGQVTRHRLNRSGDRQLNRALHTVVVARLRDDPDTRAYAARRRAEGKSIRDVRRCLKRAVARQFFKLLERHDQPAVEVVKVV